MGSSALLAYINELSRSVSSLQKVFDCPICLDMLNDPVRTTVCGHTFCKKCINRVLKSDFQKKPCPLCNASLSHRSISDNTNTQKILQLTLELITAINLDTGINITEHRTNNQSTHEASEDSEELFKVKKTFSNKSSIVSERRKLVSDKSDEIQNTYKKETNCHGISKTKNSRLSKTGDLKDYFLCDSKNNFKEKNKIDSVLNEKVSSKEPQSKKEEKLNDVNNITTGNGNCIKYPAGVVEKNQNSSVNSIDVDNSAGSLSSLDVLLSNNIANLKNPNVKNVVSDKNQEGIHNTDIISDCKADSGSAKNTTAVDFDMCDISIIEQRSINSDESSVVPKPDCISSEQKSSNDYDKEKDVSNNLVMDCEDLSLVQRSSIGDNMDNNVHYKAVSNNDDTLDQISIKENADNGSTKRNAGTDHSVTLTNCSPANDDDLHEKSVNVNDKVIDKNDDEEKVNFNVNVPFKLGDLSFLKDVGELKVKRNQDSISLPFVLFGTLEINLKKRKFDKLIDDDDDENFSIKVDDIKKIKLFDSPNNLINEGNKSRPDKGNTSENGRDSQIHIQDSKQFYPSASSSSSQTFKSNTDFIYGNPNDFIRSQSPRTDFDIFDEEKNSNRNKDDDDDEIHSWDESFESLSQCGLKSISQMVPQKRINLKDGHRGFDDALSVTGEDSPRGNDDLSDDCTVINENIAHNKNKIKICQREAVDFKVPFSKTLNRSLRKNIDSKVAFTQNISVNEIENSEPDNNRKCLLSDMKWNSDLNKDLNKSDQDLRNSNCIVDVSVNEIENSEPVADDLKNIIGFLNKIKQKPGSGIKSVVSEIQGNVKQMLSSKSSSAIIPAQEENDIEELQKSKHDVTAHGDNTIINASDDDDNDNINDSFSPTPPIKDVNSSGMDLGSLSSQRDKIKRSCNGNVTIMDSETNEIPSSLNDTNCLKRFNSSTYNNARDIIPSVNIETAGFTQSDKVISKSGDVDELSVTNSSQMAVDESVNVDEISAVSGNKKLNKNGSLNLSKLNKSAKSMSFVYSRLSSVQCQELKVFAFHFNSDITEDIIDGMTTHVIIGHEKDNRARHTYKYLKGVASRLWVVSSNWVSDSLKAEKVLPEEDYLVLDPSGEPGPFRCRQPDVSPPLKNFIVFPFPPFNYSTTEQIQSLILLCGGEISSLQVLADLNYKPSTPRILLMDDSSDPSISEYWMEKYHLIILNIGWLLEVVGQFKLVPINPYMMAPYSLQLLRDLSIPEEIIGEDITEEEEDCDDVSLGE